MDYFYSENYAGFIYTIDMFRISTRVNRRDRKDVLRFLHGQGLTFWNNKQAGKYDENFQADKLWLGIMPEKVHDFSHTLDECFLLTIEFNPNKMTNKDIFIYNYFINKYQFKIKRFDLAIDIPHNINNLVFFDLRKKCYSVFYKNFDDKTYYIGKGDGHTKIYNKKIESELNFELTRFETTKECDIPIDFTDFYIDFNFPILAFQPYYSLLSSDDAEDNDTYKAVLYAVNNGYPFLNLSRRYKELIKKDYVGCAQELNNDIANEVLHNFVARVVSGISNKPDKL